MRILAGFAVALISGAWMVARRWASGRWRLLPTLLLLPALVFAGNEVRWYRFETTLADAAVPALGAREAAFHCERLMRNLSVREIVAVHAVTHEAFHLAGERQEAMAECRAMGSDEAVMVRLGASPDAAHAAVLRYVREVYPQLPDDYRSRSCGLDAIARLPARR